MTSTPLTAVNWAAVVPVVSGAVIALFGVGLTSVINYRMKRLELKSKKSDDQIKRLADSADKLTGKFELIVKGIFDYTASQTYLYSIRKKLNNVLADEPIEAGSYVWKWTELWMHEVENNFKLSTYTDLENEYKSLEMIIKAEISTMLIWSNNREEILKIIKDLNDLIIKTVTINAMKTEFLIQALYFPEMETRDGANFSVLRQALEVARDNIDEIIKRNEKLRELSQESIQRIIGLIYEEVNAAYEQR